MSNSAKEFKSELHFTVVDYDNEAEFLSAVPEDELLYAAEIIEMTLDGENVAFAYLDGVLYFRRFTDGRYTFPLPLPLSEESATGEILIPLAGYAVREMIPLVITDIPREELDVIASVFPHINGRCYEDDDDTFYVTVDNELSLFDGELSESFGEIALGVIEDDERDAYAELCSDRELNKYWGYDASVDNPSADPGLYLLTARRELDESIALSLAIRYRDEFVGEAVISNFDFRGTAEIAVRLLPRFGGRGFGKMAVSALIALAKRMGLKRLKADVLNENLASIKMTEKLMSLIFADECKHKFEIEL